MLPRLTIWIIVCVFILLFYKWTIARGNTIIRNWANQNNFELVHFERCFFTGAFSWLTTSRNQIVYFVRVRDCEKHERAGWVRCGSFLGGIIFSDEVEIKWKHSEDT